MQLNIKYFGLIAEVTTCNEEFLETKSKTVSELREVLYTKYPNLKNKDFQIAQNREIVTNDSKISGEEIAVLPPFSGG